MQNTPKGKERLVFTAKHISLSVQFGTVISFRPVHTIGKNTGVGATIGATGGALGGSYASRGGGSFAAALTGTAAAVIGGVAGHLIEQAIVDGRGIEYVIALEKREIITIVQTQTEGDPAIRVGQWVMVQTSGTYRRVLPAESLPETVKRPKKIKVED